MALVVVLPVVVLPVVPLLLRKLRRRRRRRRRRSPTKTWASASSTKRADSFQLSTKTIKPTSSHLRESCGMMNAWEVSSELPMGLGKGFYRNINICLTGYHK